MVLLSGFELTTNSRPTDYESHSIRLRGMNCECSRVRQIARIGYWLRTTCRSKTRIRAEGGYAAVGGLGRPALRCRTSQSQWRSSRQLPTSAKAKAQCARCALATTRVRLVPVGRQRRLVVSFNDPLPRRDAKHDNRGPHYRPEQDANGDATRPWLWLKLWLAQLDRRGREAQTHGACVFVEAAHGQISL